MDNDLRARVTHSPSSPDCDSTQRRTTVTEANGRRAGTLVTGHRVALMQGIPLGCNWEIHQIKMKLLRGILFVSLFAGAWFVYGCCVADAAANGSVAELDAFVSRTLKEYQVPGAAVAAIQDGKVVLLKGYGVRDVTKPDAVNENTIFQLASVTKTLTGAAAATVVDDGKLDWDKPIFNYLPEFVSYDPYVTRWLTERDLLAQRTGWPAYTGDQLDSFGYDRAEILRRLRFFKPRYSLREVAQYSNPGFFMAGEVAARCAKRSWNDLVEQRLFKPLEMSRSGTVIKALQDPTPQLRMPSLMEKLSSSTQQSSTSPVQPAPALLRLRICQS